MSGRKAYVSAERNGYLFVFDEASDGQDERVIAKLASQLSTTLRCTVFAVLNHDDDILWYQLYERGVLTDRYNSTPDYWSGVADPGPPEGGNAKQLCAAFHRGDIAAVERVLHTPGEGYAFATDRHSDLLQALGLPELTVTEGFGEIQKGDTPQGWSAQDLCATR
jgi:hypothetical protein